MNRLLCDSYNIAQDEPEIKMGLQNGYNNAIVFMFYISANVGVNLLVISPPTSATLTW
jgi:hypothetical protein